MHCGSCGDGKRRICHLCPAVHGSCTRGDLKMTCGTNCTSVNCCRHHLRRLHCHRPSLNRVWLIRSMNLRSSVVRRLGHRRARRDSYNRRGCWCWCRCWCWCGGICCHRWPRTRCIGLCCCMVWRGPRPWCHCSRRSWDMHRCRRESRCPSWCRCCCSGCWRCSGRWHCRLDLCWLQWCRWHILCPILWCSSLWCPRGRSGLLHWRLLHQWLRRLLLHWRLLHWQLLHALLLHWLHQRRHLNLRCGLRRLHRRLRSRPLPWHSLPLHLGMHCLWWLV
mmetsp:Transcript_28190/g.51554  ORF Transcript_28190/g.51554 Transcript_28190/m.51554 type:complete len:277 (+) Transcript_28190:2125-2955(+)